MARLAENVVHVPNVAGNRESKNLGVDDRAEGFLTDFFPALATWRGIVQVIARLVGLYVMLEGLRAGRIDRSIESWLQITTLLPEIMLRCRNPRIADDHPPPASR